MENKVLMTNGQLIVKPQGLNKLLALKSKLVFDLDHVAGATIDEGFLKESKGWRNPGTAVPGYWAGTFVKNGEKSFFNIKQSSLPVIIQLHHDTYIRLILGVEKPRQLVDQINNALTK